VKNNQCLKNKNFCRRKNILENTEIPAETFGVPEATKAQNWSEFVEITVVNFFNDHKVEKMAVEDGYGNKAKLTRTKDGGIKIEHSSIILL
jgi:hypothetical protein